MTTETQARPVSPGEYWTRKLEEMAREGHLISPATQIQTLPEGFEPSVTRVLIDQKNETFKVGFDRERGKLFALTKPALERLAAAAALTWLPSQCHRVFVQGDPRYLDPRFCHYRVVGQVQNFDGTPRMFTAEKTVDLRAGSPQEEAMIERAINSHRRSLEYKLKDGKIQQLPSDEEIDRQGRAKGRSAVIEASMHIESNAETKAKLRAIRSVLGIRAHYTEQDLRKTFVVVRLAFTGRTADPELSRSFSAMRAAAALGATNLLYGGAPAGGYQGLPSPAQQVNSGAFLPAPPAAPAALPAPGEEPDPDDLVDDEPDTAEAAKPAEIVQEGAECDERPEPQSRRAPEPEGVGEVIRLPDSSDYGDDAGKPIGDAKPGSLAKFYRDLHAWLTKPDTAQHPQRHGAQKRTLLIVGLAPEPVCSGLIDLTSAWLDDDANAEHPCRGAAQQRLEALFERMGALQSASAPSDAPSGDSPPGM